MVLEHLKILNADPEVHAYKHSAAAFASHFQVPTSSVQPHVAVTSNLQRLSFALSARHT
jgi:hypothetical protein